MKQMTKKEATNFFDNKGWMLLNERKRAELQINQDLLCMPFDIFHSAIEKTIGRSIFTHEFGSKGHVGLKKELFEGKAPPTFQEIMELIPEDKRVLVVIK